MPDRATPHLQQSQPPLSTTIRQSQCRYQELVDGIVVRNRPISLSSWRHYQAHKRGIRENPYGITMRRKVNSGEQLGPEFLRLSKQKAQETAESLMVVQGVLRFTRRNRPLSTLPGPIS